MTNSTTPIFPVDPADIPAFQKWWNAQNTQSTSPLRSIDIREILIGLDALLELPAVLQRSGVPDGARVLLVMDEIPMCREKQDLKPFVQALLRNADYQVETLWLRGDTYGLVHADFEQVEHVRAAIAPGAGLVALGAGSVTDIVSISKGGFQNKGHERLPTKEHQSSKHEAVELGGTRQHWLR